jgi:uncharacterized protein YjbI with pentapeptide repeats
MANEEHLAILRQGVEVWNEWRHDQSYFRPDLSGADLKNVNLSMFDLEDAILTGADLTDANMTGANLEHAGLGHARLVGTNMTDAFCYGAGFRGSNVDGANFSKADFIYSSLEGVDLTQVELTGACFAEACLDKANLTGKYLDLNFRSASLENAILTGCVLHRSDFSLANLKYCDFSGASFYETILVGSDLSGSDLSQAKLSGAILGDVDLSCCKGLQSCTHQGPSTIDHRTLQRSGSLPINFLRGVGLTDNLIEYMPSLLNQPIQMYSCFLSYSSRDQEFAERLHADLQNKGVRCWFAPHDMPIGAKILDTIDEAIRLRDKLLLILSEDAIASDWVEDEVTKAYAEERRRGQTVLFPIRLDDAVLSTEEAWAVKLRDGRHIGDFTRWKDHDAYTRALERLLRDLQMPRENS